LSEAKLLGGGALRRPETITVLDQHRESGQHRPAGQHCAGPRRSGVRFSRKATKAPPGGSRDLKAEELSRLLDKAQAYGQHYDLGYIDLEQRTLQTIDNPFGSRLSHMSAGRTLTCQAASKTWRKLNGTNQLPRVIEGVRCTNDVAESDASQSRAAASPTFSHSSSGSIGE